ncbi:MAG: 16S rRNA (cytosine(1402)-N(4))-methyltransferase [Nitrospira sp.]|nr:16S rRNA (cytosine(1402)-N(4))-methyltransferase [Nitrospira sp.]
MTSGRSGHVQVLGNEVSFWLDFKRPVTILDCTVGYGGHAEMLLDHSDRATRLVGLDQDSQAIAFSQERLVVDSRNLAWSQSAGPAFFRGTKKWGRGDSGDCRD